MEPAEIYGRLEAGRREIRLLRLLPGSWDAPLCCVLDVVSLSDPPDYQGLSYVWGNIGINKTIQLNGRPFGVTVNLWGALRRLRRSTCERILWADATCINQDDLVEKSYQVALMGEIYSSASEVFIWLGDSMSEANDWLKDSPGNVEDGKNITWIRGNVEQILELSKSPNRESEALSAFATLYLLSIDEHWTAKLLFVEDSEGRYHIAKQYLMAWQATLKLLCLSWWTRMWVVQEQILAKNATLVVGAVSAPWHLISDFCRSYLKHLPPGACCYSSATWKMTSHLWDDIAFMRLTFMSFYTSKQEMLELRNNSTSAAFWEFLWLLRHKIATDPRDKVYGILGLLPCHGQPLLVPDYSITTAETFSRCTETLMKSDLGLAALIGPRLRRSGLPTWVPDFLPKENSGSVLFFHNLLRRISSTTIFNACGTQTSRFSLQQVKLSLQGILVDKIRDTAPSWKDGYVAQTFREWEDLSCVAGEHRNEIYPSACTRTDAFWRTMVRDTIRDYPGGEKVRRANSTDEASYMLFRKWLTDSSSTNDIGTMGYSDFVNFRKSFFIATQHQSFFTTYKGYIGLGDLPQPDDEVWVLFGGTVPFIVRPYPGDSELVGSYFLVGDCYVHGIMDGEAVDASSEMKASEIRLV